MVEHGGYFVDEPSEELRKAARVVLNDCLKAGPQEVGLIITDEPKRKIGYVLFEIARMVSREAFLVEISPRLTHGSEPPGAVAALMKNVDYILAPTSKSLSHTEARREACKHGVRCATMPDIQEESMLRALNADYSRIADLSRKLASRLTRAKQARVKTAKGTDILIPLEGREGLADTGLVHNPGDFSNLPAGEAYIAPLEGGSTGIIVIDASMAGIGLLPPENTIRVDVLNGFAQKFYGCHQADMLREMLNEHGANGFNLAELGIGTNYKAQVCGSVLEDEKVYGTIHLAFGDNASMGGNVKVNVHLDGVILNPTLELDGQVIIEKGNYLI
ncbi:aminopeptidase [bacterium]|nr:aminopeptidase [bacterium]